MQKLLLNIARACDLGSYISIQKQREIVNSSTKNIEKAWMDTFRALTISIQQYQEEAQWKSRKTKM